MSNVKTVIKLEHPSKGSRKESILTDEMLVAFCESRSRLAERGCERCFFRN